MKRALWMMVVVVMMAVPLLAADDPNALKPAGVVWPMASDEVAEVRIGVEYGPLEAYVGPRHDKRLDSETDFLTDLRVYGIYSAINANMAANLFGAEAQLPEGDLYGGLFMGWEMEDGRMESGWCMGGRVSVDDQLGHSDRFHAELTTEYQYVWDSWRSDETIHEFLVGLRIRFK